MGLDLLYLALGMGSEISAAGHGKDVLFHKGADYVERLGYRYFRQKELHDMIFTSNPEKKRQFSEILGRDVQNMYRAEEKEDAIREIAEREGWRYFDSNELFADPYYRSLIGMKARPVSFSSTKVYPERILLSNEELREYENYVKKENQKYDEVTRPKYAISIVILSIAFLIAIINLENIESTNSRSGTYTLFVIMSYLTMGSMLYGLYDAIDNYNNPYMGYWAKVFTYVFTPAMTGFLTIGTANNNNAEITPAATVVFIALAVVVWIYIYAIVFKEGKYPSYEIQAVQFRKLLKIMAAVVCASMLIALIAGAISNSERKRLSEPMDLGDIPFRKDYKTIPEQMRDGELRYNHYRAYDEEP